MISFLLESSVHHALVPEPAAPVPLVLVDGVTEEDGANGDPSPEDIGGHGRVAEGPGDSCGHLAVSKESLVEVNQAVKAWSY